MKFKLIVCALLAVGLLTGTADLSAQKRRTTTRRTTTTKKTTKPKTQAVVTGPAIDDDALVNTMYQGFIDTSADFNGGLWMFQQLNLEPNNITWTLGGGKFGGSWDVTGNKLNVVSGSMKLQMASPDKGYTFTGRMFNGRKPAGNPCFLYSTRLLDEPIDTLAFKNDILHGKYTAYATFYKNDDTPELGAPVKLKFTPGESDNEGSYKVSTDNEALSQVIGIIRGTYKFDKVGFHLSKIDGSELWWKYENANRCVLTHELGNKSVPGKGNVAIYLYIFLNKKP